MRKSRPVWSIQKSVLFTVMLLLKPGKDNTYVISPYKDFKKTKQSHQENDGIKILPAACCKSTN